MWSLLLARDFTEHAPSLSHPAYEPVRHFCGTSAMLISLSPPVPHLPTILRDASEKDESRKQVLNNQELIRLSLPRQSMNKASLEGIHTWLTLGFYLH